jgi:two-component system, OmpR family, sensor kinase
MVRYLADVPLRVKLIAAVLGLVTAALLVIGVASALVMRKSLLDRVDDQLRAMPKTLDKALLHPSRSVFPLPTNFLAALGDRDSIEEPVVSSRPQNELPDMPDGTEIRSHLDANVPYTTRAKQGGERWRLYVSEIATGQVLVVGESLSDVDRTVDGLVAAELVIGFGVLLVLAAVGIVTVQASLQPLREIERTAAAIAAGDLTRRIPESPPETEVGHLARALNAMLSQIEGAFRVRAASEERMRQFVADASHELRTPLTSIRGFAELYRQGAAREPSDTEVLLRRIEDEAARMGLLVEDLLLLARLDRERPLSLAPLDLRVIVTDAAEAARAVAPDRDIQLDLERDEAVQVLGDESRLRQVVGNLVTNALTHTPAGTPVKLRLGAAEGNAFIDVVDSGAGLSQDQAEHVFERFYRVDKARTRQAAGTSQAVTPHSGTGLGLAIVAALVAAHGGTVSVESVPGSGATFRVELPLHIETE